MSIIIDSYAQLSPEWFQARVANPGGSSFSKIVTSTGAPSKQRQKYLYQLAGEAILGEKTETYTNAAMQRGIELEGEARALFELVNNVEVKQAAIVYPDEQRRYHISPDGLLPDSGIEIKCPLLPTAVGYLLNNKLPTEYIAQVQGSMLVTGYPSWFFMSYYPQLKPLILEIKRNEEFIDKLRIELDKFCTELAMIIQELKAK